MPALLPIKESQREIVNQISHALQPHFAEIRAQWRSQMFAEFQSGRACHGGLRAAYDWYRVPRLQP